MIRLKKDGKYFELAPNEKITTEWLSTVFNEEDTFSGSYTYPFKAGFTPVNNTLLQNAQQLENRSARKTTMVTIEVFGRPWKQAKMNFDITPDGYEMNCLIDNAEFAKLIKEKMLSDVFVIYDGGVFKDYVYDLLGSTQTETFNAFLERAKNPGKGSCVFYEQKNDTMFGSFNDGGTDLPYAADYRINPYTPTSNFLRLAMGPSEFNKYFYSPSYYLVWVVQKLCGYLGFEATGDFLTDPFTKTLVIDNPCFFGIREMFAVDGCKLAPAKHLPKIKIADFIKQLRSTFQLAIYFDGNERRAYFNYSADIIQSGDTVDITGYTEPGLTIKSNLPAGYELTQAIDSNDDLFKTFEYVKTFTIGESDEFVKKENFFGTLFMSSLTEPRVGTTAKYRIPRKRLVGNGYTEAAVGTASENQTGYTKNEFTLRLLNYQGLKKDSAGTDYTYACSDSAEPDGTASKDALALWLGGDNGLIKRFIKDWYIFYLRTESVELTAHMPGYILHNMSPLKKLAFTTTTQARMTALFSQVSFESADEHADRLSAKLVVFPIYNQAASDLKTFTEFKPTEVENPGQIYVKFRLVETEREEIGFLKTKVVLKIVNDGFLDFFSDKECTKPRSVSNLPVNMLYNYRGLNARNYVIDQPFVVYASGKSHQIVQDIGIDQTHHYKSSKDFWDKTYDIRPGPDYIIVR